MNTLNTLSTLLSEKIMAGSLENISLTNSNSLRTFAKCLVASTEGSAVINVNPSEIHATVAEFANAVNDTKKNGDVLIMFKQISDAFAKRVGDSYKELSRIKDTVNALVSAASKEANIRISSDPVLASTEAKNNAPKLKTVRWDLMIDASEPVLINKMCTKLGIEEIPTGNDAYIHDTLIMKMPYATESNKPQLDPVNVKPSQARAMIDAIAAKSGLDKNVVKVCVAHIMSLDEYKCKKAVQSIRRFSTGESAESINDMLQMVYTYNKIMSLMNRDVLGTAASTQEAIDARTDVMQSYIDMTAYLCSNYRNNIWRDAIVVPGMKINTDNWQDFCNEDKKTIKNNPVLAIVQYKNKIYGEDRIPAYGIPGSVIAAKCDDIAKEAYAEASANTIACNQKKKEIFRDVFIQTAGNWLRQQKKFSDAYLYNNEPERFAASIFDSNRDDSVENMYYTVILNSCYIDTLTSKLHTRLRNEYKKLVSEAESLNDRDIINADTKVLADTINEYMVDLLLV